MIKDLIKVILFLFVILSITMIACSEDEDPMTMTDPDPNPTPDPDPDPDPEPVEVNIENLLIDQIDIVIIPTYIEYQTVMGNLLSAAQVYVGDINDANLESLRGAYLIAYTAYQAAAVHNYYATANADLVNTTNLYPIDIPTLEELIDTEAYNFNVSAQQRANGYPALDYLLYGLVDVNGTFSANTKTAVFLVELITAMMDKADLIVDRWTGRLRDNFSGNGGVELGSSVSVQLNRSLVYHEDHIRENKVGIPVGRLGPNDTPIEPDGTKIEAYYQSIIDGNDNVALSMVRAAISEMEDIYLGTGSSGEDGIGYEDLLLNIDQQSLDTDIKAQFQAIYDEIDNRTMITGDEDLYNSIQALVTLYKSDLFPVLNVQDADGANDGD